MFRKWTFCHFRLANMKNSHSGHQAKEGKRSLEGDRVWALGALGILESQKKLAAEKWRETHFLSNAKREIWIKDDVETETAAERNQVEDAEAAIWHEQEDKGTAENAGSMTREPKNSVHEMMVGIGDRLSNLGSSNDGENGADEDNHETEQGKLSEDDKPGWVRWTISKMGQQRIERFRQMLIKLHTLTQPGWEDAANYCQSTDKKPGTSEISIRAVVKSQMHNDAVSPAPTLFGEHMECLDIVCGISQMLQGTSPRGHSHRRLGSGNPQSNTCISSLAPNAELNSSPMWNLKPVDVISFYHCIWPPQLITT